tara:strand:- start:1732 stop:2559 length:828 start_codon:yes stop_codon:yes gene_type:complete
MIDRENLKFFKNIMDLQNKNVNYRTLDDIVYAIKEDDQFGFLHNIISSTNEGIDYRLLDNVIQTAKKEPDIEYSLLDSFSTPQVNAKFNIVNHAEKLGLINKESEIVIFGCWFGSILVPALAPKVKKIIAIDMDERVINVAKNRLFMDYENVEFIADDIFDKFRNEYENADLFINTSCEHMRPMSEWGPKGPRSLYKDSPFGEPVTRKVPWWTRVKKGAHFAFQSNDMFNIDTHINCVNNSKEFKLQLPENTEVLIEDEINDERGTRFTLIGRII